MATKIFIVDDHYMLIEGIHSMLQQEKEIEWMGHATSAASCIAFLKMHSPDIILMDISLPDQSGVELCKEVKDKYPEIAVIGLSTFNQYSFIKKMMDNGASGYLLKNANKEEILKGIGAVMKGGNYFSHEAAQTISPHRTTGEVPVLTRRELEVLELIADGMTNNEMSAALFVSATTIDTHRKNLLAKFKAKNTATLIRMAVEMGFVGPHTK